MVKNEGITKKKVTKSTKKTTKNVEVKNTKTSSKNVEVKNKKISSKKVEGKSTKNKKGKKKINLKLIFGLIGVLIIISIIFISFILSNKDVVVITIDDIKYTETDFNMYAYLVKYDYFGISGTKLSEDTLNTQVSNDSEQTIAEYLKEKTISKIKVSAAILRIAKENNITLNDSDLNEIEKEKDKFIETLGGKKAFKEMLKDNKTNNDAYMEVAKVNKLYDLVYNSLYKEGKRNDLTEEEIFTYTKSYENDYVKIKQIIFLKKDLETDTYLSDTTLNQKEALAKSLVKKAKDSDNFDSLIMKYSEGYDKEVISEYYLKKELVENLRNAIDSLNVGGISDVVSTEYAYHIVIREKLDNAKLEDYLNSKREEKFIKNISDNLEKIVIINSDYLKEITIK